MITVVREVERKYAAEEAFELPSLMELTAGGNGSPDSWIAPVAEGDPVRQRLAATYFDTAALDLARAGLTLRRRTSG
jgi:inorganic triphosphatase YgiF